MSLLDHEDRYGERRVGIVGHEAAKFTRPTEEAARRLIRQLIETADVVVSGRCKLGGIDSWAIEEALKAGKEIKEFPPKVESWDLGYKPRNQQIAGFSTEVHSLNVVEYPLEYKGLRFSACYHCNTKDHIKSGGCWTVSYAQTLGKLGQIHVIR